MFTARAYEAMEPGIPEQTDVMKQQVLDTAQLFLILYPSLRVGLI